MSRCTVEPRIQARDAPPAHHVYADDGRTRTFRNPWTSFQRLSALQVLQGLEWGEREGDRALPSLFGTLKDLLVSPAEHNGVRPSIFAQTAPPVSVQVPDFQFHGARAKATWLGHAGSLVQLPSLQGDGARPYTVLFDPMFSTRCSPTQWIGPRRFTKAPCRVGDLPPIDAVVISHNHYDHLDRGTIEELWARCKDTVHFFVPLGNKAWFLQTGVAGDCVTELDWWDSAEVRFAGARSEGGVRITCTPAQHSSGRTLADANHTLWASWVVEHWLHDDMYRVFFAGDTGYCSRGAPRDEDVVGVCPAFAEIRQVLGAPDLLLLPVSVGATYAYIKGFDPLPPAMSLMPRLGDNITSPIHMTPRDAVDLFHMMIDRHARRTPVALGVHWGTFVEGTAEIIDTVIHVGRACAARGLAFARDEHVSWTAPTFALVDHGASVTVPMHTGPVADGAKAADGDTAKESTAAQGTAASSHST